MRSVMQDAMRDVIHGSTRCRHGAVRLAQFVASLTAKALMLSSSSSLCRVRDLSASHGSRTTTNPGGHDRSVCRPGRLDSEADANSEASSAVNAPHLAVG